MRVFVKLDKSAIVTQRFLESPCLPAVPSMNFLFIRTNPKIQNSNKPTECIRYFFPVHKYFVFGLQVTKNYYTIWMKFQKANWSRISECNQKNSILMSSPMQRSRHWEVRSEMSWEMVSFLCHKACPWGLDCVTKLWFLGLGGCQYFLCF
jgi:hypothetical protein